MRKVKIIESEEMIKILDERISDFEKTLTESGVKQLMINEFILMKSEVVMLSRTVEL